jgi:tRNA-2-methylthio-N6-dimethylallyladenosine synthase
MRYSIITYGCQMNHSDSERIASTLENIGYSPAKNANLADLVVINMCSVRQQAVDRAYGKINDFSKIKKIKVILTGCALKSDINKLKDSVDYILDIKNLQNWPKIISKRKGLKVGDYLSIKPKRSTPLSSSIPISNGCNNFCTYCAVPFARGPLRCRSHKEIIKEIKKTILSGTKEIWLLGQNVNDYLSPDDESVNFAELLKMVNKVPGDFWIRFTSSNPKNFSDELAVAMAKCKKVTPYLNLPVQSGDDGILKRMNRPYDVNSYKKLVKKIKAAFNMYRQGAEKELSLSTDVIVGFPGETKKQFQNSVKLFREMEFDMAYISKYSTRPQAACEKMKDSVSRKEKEGRWNVLNEILKKTAQKRNKKLAKSIEKDGFDQVLAENSKEGFLTGKNRHYKTVKFRGKKNLVGSFIKVKIKAVTPWGMEGILNE